MQKRTAIFTLLLVILVNRWIFAVEANKSIAYLPTANGLCYASYNLQKGFVDAFYPHINDDWDVGERTPNLVQAVGFRLVVGNKSILLAQQPAVNRGYIAGTSIIRVEQKLEKAELISFIWSPMIMDQKALLWVLHVPKAKKFRLVRDHFQPFIEPPLREMQTLIKDSWDDDDLWMMYAVVFTAGMTPPMRQKVFSELRKADPKRLLEAEERWWMHWHMVGHEPAEIINKKHDVFIQSNAFIKMAQCRELGPCFGQIVNSLAPFEDNVALTRDMAYSVLALSSVGHFSEARAALKFMLYADAGSFRTHRLADQEWGLGRNYMVSLSHYAGIGFERAANLGDNSPALYFSSHPLFLWALQDYYRRSSDRAFLDQVWLLVKQHVLEPLIFSLDSNDLIRADSGLWDTPAPGEHFLYTSAGAYQGLTCAAILAQSLGDEETVKRCTRRAVQVRESILSRLTYGKAKVLRRSLEKKSFPELLDASTLEAVNWQVVNPEWKSARATLAALDAFLRVDGMTRGYALGFQNAKQIGHEHLFATLRGVEAMMRMKKNREAKVVLDWVVEQAARNGEMVPEYFDRTTAAFKGSYPTIGAGAGAFILACLAK